jgi:hypothetical protein
VPSSKRGASLAPSGQRTEMTLEDRSEFIPGQPLNAALLLLMGFVLLSVKFSGGLLL